MTLDPILNPALERWLEDAIRHQTEARLRDVLQQAAEEIYDRVQQSSMAAAPAADEVREPATGVASFGFGSLGSTIALALEHAAGALGPARSHTWTRLEPTTEAVADLPSTVAELREQSLSTAEAADRLGVNASRVRQRLLARTLYGFKESPGWWVPSFQFENGRTIPGIQRVFSEIRQSASPVAVARWFVLPWADLVVDEEREVVVSPRTWLLEGRDPAPVAAQARVL